MLLRKSFLAGAAICVISLSAALADTPAGAPSSGKQTADEPPARLEDLLRQELNKSLSQPAVEQTLLHALLAVAAASRNQPVPTESTAMIDLLARVVGPDDAVAGLLLGTLVRRQNANTPTKDAAEILKLIGPLIEPDQKKWSAALAAAKKALDDKAKEEPAPPKDSPKVINVFGAFYGDIDVIHRVASAQARFWAGEGHNRFAGLHGDRFCSATRAVRTICQQKAACFSVPQTESDGQVGSVDPVKLCGYDPTPYAEPETKGLVVFYECLDPNNITPPKTAQAAKGPTKGATPSPEPAKAGAAEAAKADAAEPKPRKLDNGAYPALYGSTKSSYRAQIRSQEVAEIRCSGAPKPAPEPKP